MGLHLAIVSFELGRPGGSTTYVWTSQLMLSYAVTIDVADEFWECLCYSDSNESFFRTGIGRSKELKNSQGHKAESRKGIGDRLMRFN